MAKKLIERIKNIARIEGIDESKLILEEAEYFLKAHEGHGNHSIEIGYDRKNENVESIRLLCSASDLVHTNECPHNNKEIPAELMDSIVYSRRPCFELDYQKERRES